MSNKAIVLSSGGIDSTTCLAVAINNFGADNVISVSILYGQKHSKELECAESIAEYYNIDHKVLDLSNIFGYSDCALISGSTQKIEHESYADQKSRKDNGMVSTYVPFRNGTMLASIATLAVSLFPDDQVAIYIGAHSDDAAGDAYADCSEAFIEAMTKAINIGTYKNVTIIAPFSGMTKAQVVAEGLKLKVPYYLTWSCYEGGDVQCGTCGTCIDRKAAFKANGIKDPVPYADDVTMKISDIQNQKAPKNCVYKIAKTLEISGSHRLDLPYPSKCSNLHGHNWMVTIHCRSTELNDCGMVVDFAKIKALVFEKFDHEYLNDNIPDDMNPTAENLAKLIGNMINESEFRNRDGSCYKVIIQESSGNTASWEVI